MQAGSFTTTRKLLEDIPADEEDHADDIAGLLGP
jgi:hypothetical protein